MTVHRRNMQRALELAALQNGRTGPNPSVGCVILDRDGNRISEAATGDGGRPHAEQLALSRLPVGAASGGIVYVTLEPCRERSGGEASCSQRLLEAGVARVVIATRDPHPLGRDGILRLQEAGIQVDLGVLQDQANAIYRDFFDAHALD